MASGFTTPDGKGLPASPGPKKDTSMAKSKTSSSKSAGPFAVKGGGSGKMHKFGGATPQKPGVTATSNSSGKGAPFAKGGGSGKMHGFSPVKPQKSGRTGQA